MKHTQIIGKRVNAFAMIHDAVINCLLRGNERANFILHDCIFYSVGERDFSNFIIERYTH